jgi:hypothetical protein
LQTASGNVRGDGHEDPGFLDSSAVFAALPLPSVAPGAVSLGDEGGRCHPTVVSHPATINTITVTSGQGAILARVGCQISPRAHEWSISPPWRFFTENGTRTEFPYRF